MEQQLKNILHRNEKIIETYKPNKLRFFMINAIIFYIIWLFIIGLSLLAIFVPDSDGSTIPFYTLYIVLGAFGGALILNYFFLFMSYKKRLYLYTDRRIIIQSGIVGIDFKSLDHDTIGATEVRVDFIDKVLKKDTGTIRFGSMSSPINTAQSMFAFYGIEKPYEVYQEIRAHINETKEK